MSERLSPGDFSDLLKSQLSFARATAKLPDTPLPDSAIASLGAYLGLLVSWNERMDLVAPAPLAVLIERHLIDCIVACEVISQAADIASGSRVLDVGSGAGLPGVVWAICRPGLNYYLCEPREKRVLFLKEVRRALNVKNLEILRARMEDLGDSEHGKFELITARALGNYASFFPLAVRALEIRGYVSLFVGADSQDLHPPPGLMRIGELGYHLSTDSPERGRSVILWQRNTDTSDS